MGLYDEFKFRPASFLPHSNLSLEELDRIRNIKREDMEYTNENGFSVRVVQDPTLLMVMDIFHRIYLSDVLDKHLTIICPNQWPAAYSSVAEMLNKYNVSARNVDAFAMDEWADQDGNVAPLTYGGGLGYSFMNHFYKRIREDLRPPVSQWHTFNNDNKGRGVYSRMIEDVGGADVVYSATGWPGHTAFIDPGSPEFKADSLEEFIKIKSGLVTEVPLTICENSLFAPMGSSGDVWGVPPRAATIGPYDIVNAKERFELHNLMNPDGSSWQRMVSRIELYGPISMECPASIMRLGKGTCYVSEQIAKPIRPWYNGIEDKDL
jgi:6-phosphogluconolactonase/glucosamine-6-phosphate isomerase/deaminase